MSVGQRIKDRRKELKLNQSELAKMVNASSQVVSNWERGYTDPDVNDLQSLSYALKTSSDFLLTGELNENDLDSELVKWLEYGKQLRGQGNNLSSIEEMLTNIIQTIRK